MKIAYFDCYNGIAGDMCLGALVDAGASFDCLKKELEKLGLEGYKLECRQVKRKAIAGTKVGVIVSEKQPHRHLSDILNIIDSSLLENSIKDKAKKIFSKLAQAEAKIHGCDTNHVHFHEVGAVDAIVDIIGTLICLRLLGIEKAYSSELRLGRGYVKCMHGTIPLPAPAVIEILASVSGGVPVSDAMVEGETVTPTGAAIISTIAESFGPMPKMRITSTGYGAGTKDYGIPNFLRVIVGKAS